MRMSYPNWVFTGAVLQHHLAMREGSPSYQIPALSCKLFLDCLRGQTQVPSPNTSVFQRSARGGRSAPQPLRLINENIENIENILEKMSNTGAPSDEERKVLTEFLEAAMKQARSAS